MIMLGVKKIETRNVSEYAWSRLARYQNVDFCAEVLAKTHGLEKRQLQNAKNQAEQIKYCLAQAKEYFLAAEVVSLATRPVLLYYATMSLALAEILRKQSGDSRLSKLRESHPAHGLALKLASDPKISDDLNDSASKLIAKPQYDGQGRPFGTFELWHRSARESPIGGDYFVHTGPNNTQTFSPLLMPVDIRFPVISKAGLSLLDCLRELPYLLDTLHSSGVNPSFVRGLVKSDYDTNNPERSTLTLILHPQNPALIEKFGELCVCSPSLVNEVEFHEMGSGSYIASMQKNSSSRLSLPSAMCLDSESVFFTCSKDGLNEFGYLYVALHICGNFARYYPDLWLKNLEKSTSLSLAIEELCRHAVERLPLLTLSEMMRLYHIQGR